VKVGDLVRLPLALKPDVFDVIVWLDEKNGHCKLARYPDNHLFLLWQMKVASE
jgi:hypothetical protein